MEVHNLTISHASPGIDLSPTAGASLILAESNCRYLRPVMWPDTVTISTRTIAIGETSWTTEFQVVHTRARYLDDGDGDSDYGVLQESKEQEAVCAVGYSRLVYYDYKEGKKTPIPQELRDRINRLEGTNF